MRTKKILPAVIALSAVFALGTRFLNVDTIQTKTAVKRANNYISTIDTKAQLSYDFDITHHYDTLNQELTGVTHTANNPPYVSTDEKSVTTSSARYMFNCAGNYNSIALTPTNPVGIVTTASGGKVKKISITFNSNTQINSGIRLYGKNTAYTSPANLWSSSIASSGTSIGTIAKRDNVNTKVATLPEAHSNYSYIGIVPNGRVYIDEIKVYWDYTDDTVTISNAKLHFGGLVQKSVLDAPSVAANEVGISVARTSKLNGDAIRDVYTDPKILSSSINYSEAQSTNEDGTATSGDYAIWQAALSIPSTKFTEEITAVAWAKDTSGNYTFFTERTFSVVTLAEAYQGNATIYDSLTDNQKASIDYLAALND